MGPLSRMWALIVGVGQVGRWLSGWYEKVAVVLVFIAIVEACWFAIKHYRRIRDFKKGWRQRMAPAHFSWITKSSSIMCIIEPVMVAVVILFCGICVAVVWPLWVSIVTLVSSYDMIRYVIRKVRGKIPTEEQFSFNKVKDFPWKYGGDFDAEVIDRITAEAVSKRTQNGDNTSASNRRRRGDQKKKNNH